MRIELELIGNKDLKEDIINKFIKILNSEENILYEFVINYEDGSIKTFRMRYPGLLVEQKSLDTQERSMVRSVDTSIEGL